VALAAVWVRLPPPAFIKSIAYTSAKRPKTIAKTIARLFILPPSFLCNYPNSLEKAKKPTPSPFGKKAGFIASPFVSALPQPVSRPVAST